MVGKFIRFGEVPKTERSVNFLKLTFDEQSDFSCDVDILGYTEACERLPDYVFECGVSVFQVDTDGLPKMHSLQQLNSMLSRLGAPVYLVQGEQVGWGNDDEPLIRNIKIIKRYNIPDDVYLKKVLKILYKNFTQVRKRPQPYTYNRATGYRIYAFAKDVYRNKQTGQVDILKVRTKHNPDWEYIGQRFVYAFLDWEFESPKPGFSVIEGIKGRTH